jgi:hypothetical protein
VTIDNGTITSKGYAGDLSILYNSEETEYTKTITVNGGNFSDLTFLPYFKTGSTETITLQRDLSDVSNVAFIDGNVTLDLNGHAITAAKTMKTSLTSTDTLFGVRRGAKFTVNATGGGSITSSLCCTIKLTEGNDQNREGYSTKDATLVVNGGTITGYQYAISGNGNRHGSDITINNGTFIATNTTVTDNTGGDDAIALYQPQDGKLTIKGGSFTGFKSGVELRSGTLLVEGGTFTSTATSFYAGVNGNGGTTRSAGLVIAQHNTYKAIDATIKGGTFTGGTDGYALYNLKNTNSGANAGEVSVKIQGGTFNQAIFSDESTKAVVTGGKFKFDPNDYYDTNSYQATQTDGYYIVGQKAE